MMRRAARRSAFAFAGFMCLRLRAFEVVISVAISATVMPSAAATASGLERSFAPLRIKSIARDNDGLARNPSFTAILARIGAVIAAIRDITPAAAGKVAIVGVACTVGVGE